MADHKLFQDERTGKLVEFISKHDKEYAMVKDAAGVITYLSLEQLVPYDKDKGRMAKIKAPELHIPEEEAPARGGAAVREMQQEGQRRRAERRAIRADAVLTAARHGRRPGWARALNIRTKV